MNQQRFPAYILVSLSLMLPSIALSYVLWVPGLGEFTLPYGQYIFFCVTIIGAIYFALKTGVKTARTAFQNKIIYFFILLFMAGFALSMDSLWNLRLLLIVTSISFSAIVMAIFVHQSQQINHKWVVGILLLPFAVPVFLAFFLEYFGPINLGFELTNIKHRTYSPMRWHFLSQSANGFGFNAALIFLATYIASFITPDFRNKLLCMILGCVVAVALFYSGTRAAFIFAFSAIVAFHLFYHGARYILFFIAALCVISVSLIGVFGISEILDFLRIDSDLNRLSSRRWQGIVGLWEIFQSSPLVGKGFGASDNGLPVYPTNIFYMALPVEVGIFGFAGAIGLLFLPAWLSVKQILEKKQLAFLRNKSFLMVFSTCCLAGFVPYFIFEFNILRVSAVNQLFFFCWGYLYFTLQQEQKIHLKDTGRG